MGILLTETAKERENTKNEKQNERKKHFFFFHKFKSMTYTKMNLFSCLLFLFLYRVGSIFRAKMYDDNHEN